MKEITLDDVKELREKFNAYTDNAQPYEFPILFDMDIRMRKTAWDYEQASKVIDQANARAMFRVVLKFIGEDISEYLEENQ